jgi:hypothetical protein
LLPKNQVFSFPAVRSATNCSKLHNLGTTQHNPQSSHKYAVSCPWLFISYTFRHCIHNHGCIRIASLAVEADKVTNTRKSIFGDASGTARFPTAGLGELG